MLFLMAAVMIKLYNHTIITIIIIFPFFMIMSNTTKQRIVIIGGGIMGCSLAYHLCQAGAKDVLLLEKAELTSGSTWHAAGQVPHAVSDYALLKITSYTSRLYERLEAETGQSATWHGCGSLRMAYSEGERDWLHHIMSVGRGAGVPMEMMTPSRIREVHPFYNLDGICAALHTPEDGHADPAGAAFALAKGARQMGADVRRQWRVTGISRRDDGGFVVHGGEEDIPADIVVNAGGTYARQIGAWVGLDLPIANMLHHYLVTEKVPEFASLEKELPVVRDNVKISGYLRMEQQSGLIGIYEKRNAATVWDDGTPWESENELFDADYDRIMPWLEGAMERMPVLADKGIKRVVHGAITHPPDGNMLLGPTAVNNFWLCCGAQVGIGWGPGVGKYLAQWMLTGAADVSLRSFEPQRFGARLDDTYRLEKGKEDYQLRHETPFPHLDRPACRPSHSKLSPLYEPLKARGAVYEEAYGWERPFWYATGDMPREHRYSFRRDALHDIVGAEVAGLRQGAGIADLTAFAKLEISGRDAAAFLNRVSSNKLPQKIGGIVLSYLVMENGRLEGETTIIKLDDDRYYLVYATVREAALISWLERQRRRAADEMAITNVSEQYGVIMLAGPAARRILAQHTDAPLDNAAFPWLSARVISVAGVGEVRALRVTYTGELGWELHIPMAGMRAVYDALVGGGDALTFVGSAALNAVRMEKLYRSGHEITNEVTLAEADVTRFSRGGGFQGAAESLQSPTRWRLACLRLDEPPGVDADPDSGDTVWHNGVAVGQVTSGGYGYAVGYYLVFAYLPPALITDGGEFEIMVMGAARRAVIVQQCPYDADNQRPRAAE